MSRIFKYKRTYAALLLILFALLAFVTDARAQENVVLIQDLNQNEFLVVLNQQFANAFPQSISIESIQLQCEPNRRVDLDIPNPSFPYSLVLPKGIYVANYHYNFGQQAVYFGNIDSSASCIQLPTPIPFYPTPVPFFPTQVSPPVRTQTVPPLDANQISDWDLETMEGLGLCTGHTTTLQVGDRVVPVPQYQRGGVFLRSELGNFSRDSEDHLGRLTGDFRYAIVTGGPYCTEEYPNQDVSWFEVLMNANNEPQSETIFVLGYMPLQNLSGSLLLQEAVHRADHFPWEYQESLHLIATNGFPNLSNLNYPAGYVVLLPNQSMVESGLYIRNRPCQSSRDNGLVNLSDGVFQIIRRDVTGDWLEVRFADGRTGWVATRYVNTNLDNVFIRNQLLPSSADGCFV